MRIPRPIIRISLWICFILVGIFLSFILLIIGLFYIMIPWHDFTLWRLERILFSQIQHPPNSHLIERKTFLGSRYTDTEECTYAIGEFRTTPLSRDALLDAYTDNTNIFSFAGNLPIHVVVIENNTSLPLDNPADAWITNFKQNVSQSTPDITYYLVYLYEPGKPWWGDIRCYEADL